MHIKLSALWNGFRWVNVCLYIWLVEGKLSEVASNRNSEEHKSGRLLQTKIFFKSVEYEVVKEILPDVPSQAFVDI